MELLIIIFFIALSILSVIFGIFYINKQRLQKEQAPLFEKEKKDYKLAHFDRIIQKSTIEIHPEEEPVETELPNTEPDNKPNETAAATNNNQHEPDNHENDNEAINSNRRRENNRQQIDLKTAIVYSNILKRKKRI